MKEAGLDVSKSDLLRMRPEDLVLIDDPTHPLYDPRVHDPVDMQLVASIRRRGCDQPILVRKNGVKKNKKKTPIVEVMAGRDRVKAARWLNENEKLGLKVPVQFKSGETADHVLAALGENAKRRESIKSKATKIAAALKLGKTEEEVADEARMTPAQVREHVEFLSLAPEVQDAIERGLSKAYMTPLSEIPREDQPKVLDKLTEGGTVKPTAEDAAEKVEAAKDAADGKPAAPAAPKWRMMPKRKIETTILTLEDHGSQEALLLAAGFKLARGQTDALDMLPDALRRLLAPSKDQATKETPTE